MFMYGPPPIAIPQIPVTVVPIAVEGEGCFATKTSASTSPVKRPLPKLTKQPSSSALPPLSPRGNGVRFDELRDMHHKFKKLREDTPPPGGGFDNINRVKERKLGSTESISLPELKGRKKNSAAQFAKECSVWDRKSSITTELKLFITEIFNKHIFIEGHETLFGEGKFLDAENLEKAAQTIFKTMLKSGVLLKTIQVSLKTFKEKLRKEEIQFPKQLDELVEKQNPLEFVKIFRSMPQDSYRSLIETIIGGAKVIKKIKKWGTPSEIRDRLSSLLLDLMKIKRDFEKEMPPFTIEKKIPLRDLTYREVLDNWFRGGCANLDKIYVDKEELAFEINPSGSNEGVRRCQKKNLELLIQAICSRKHDVDKFFSDPDEPCPIPELKMQGVELLNDIEKSMLSYFASYGKNYFKIHSRIKPSFQRPLDQNNLIGSFKQGDLSTLFTQKNTYIIHLAVRSRGGGGGIPIGFFTLEWTLELINGQSKMSLISTKCSPVHFWSGQELLPEKSEGDEQEKLH